MNRLKALRVAAGYDSQRELASEINRQARAKGDKAMEVSYASIARMEAGDANPRWNIVRALSDFFHVPADYLMGRETPKTPGADNENNDKLPPEVQLMVEDFKNKMAKMYPKDGGVDL